MKFGLLLAVMGAFAATEFAGGESGASGANGSPDLMKEFNTPRLIHTHAPAEGLKAIRLVTWNIDRGGELSTVGTELKQNPADLLLLQEVDSNTARDGGRDETTELARQLGLNGAYAIEFEELSQETEQHQAFIGQATLTRLPMRKSRVLRFEHQSGFWKPRTWLPSHLPLMQRRLGSRVALVSELDFAGGRLVVYNVHLESRSYGRIQADQIDEILADLQRYPPGTNVIFGGDLNTKYFPSVFLKKLERAGFQSAMGQKIERTHAIAMALDWIFVRGSLQLSAGVVRRDLKGSDHYPLFAELKTR